MLNIVMNKYIINLYANFIEKEYTSDDSSPIELEESILINTNDSRATHLGSTPTPNI